MVAHEGKGPEKREKREGDHLCGIFRTRIRQRFGKGRKKHGEAKEGKREKACTGLFFSPPLKGEKKREKKCKERKKKKSPGEVVPQGGGSEGTKRERGGRKGTRSIGFSISPCKTEGKKKPPRRKRERNSTSLSFLECLAVWKKRGGIKGGGGRKKKREGRERAGLICPFVARQLSGVGSLGRKGNPGKKKGEREKKKERKEKKGKGLFSSGLDLTSDSP